MSESLIFTKIERALLSIKEALPWFWKDSLNYQCLVRDIKNYGEECREEGLKDGKRQHHISIADINIVNKLYGEIKELKQTLDGERQGNAYLRRHISAQSAEIENLQKQTGKRKDLKHKIARLEAYLMDRDNIIEAIRGANTALAKSEQEMRVERDGFERCLKDVQGRMENLKAALQARILEDIEDIRRRNRESEPMTVSIHGVGRVSAPEMGISYWSSDEALAHELSECGYAVRHCGIAMQVIKAHLDKAFHHGKDVSAREYSSQIEFLQGKVKQRDSVIEQLKDIAKKLDEKNKAKQEELDSIEGMHYRSDEHTAEIIQRLTGELNALKNDDGWHDADKLLPFGNRRLQMHAKGLGKWGDEIHFTGYGRAVHGDRGAMMWKFEKEPPFQTDNDGRVVSWRYADE